MDYIDHALERDREQIAWDLWLSLFPYMRLGLLKFQSFGDFLRELYKPEVETSIKAIEEIESEMLRVVAAYESR